MSMGDKPALNIALRAQLAFALLAFGFFLFFIRLWYLQILRGDQFRDESENNRVRAIYIQPPRGLILDRNGKILARNRPSFNIELVREDTKTPKVSIERLAEITGTDVELLMKRAFVKGRRQAFEPKVILRDVDRDVVAKVSARKFELPGIAVNVSPAREYPYGDLAVHAIGYTREITKAQLDLPAHLSYKLGDFIGQEGIERQFEPFLQGQRGTQFVTVNASGHRVQELKTEREISGHTVTLTIDFDLQKAADDAMQGRSGAVVAIDPNNGEILALSSNPRFDPNVFSSEISPEIWRDLNNAKLLKLNNRAIQGTYAPGSVFKIFMSAASLNEKTVSVNEHINCPGYLLFGSRRFHCHKHSGHGLTNLSDALTQSCNVYYYTIGQRLGITRIHEYATRFGFNALTGVELPHEKRGIIPSEEWKRKRFRRTEDQKWYPGETLPVAVGQGAITVTPLQVARALSAVVNGGKVFQAQIVQSVIAADGRVIEAPQEPTVQRTVDISAGTLMTVRRDMERVVNDKRGTGKRAQVPGRPDIIVGGKTGTAQVRSVRVGDAAPAHLQDHAWFAGYAPAERPEIVVVALVENGGHGGVTAAPIVSQVLAAKYPAPPEIVPDKSQNSNQQNTNQQSKKKTTLAKTRTPVAVPD